MWNWIKRFYPQALKHFHNTRDFDVNRLSHAGKTKDICRKKINLVFGKIVKVHVHVYVYACEVVENKTENDLLTNFEF